MKKTELKKLSLEFRRISSYLLSSDENTADMYLFRFQTFLDENELITTLIKDKTANVDYDFKQCYNIDSVDWANFTPPKDEACHIKAQYDYLSYINENGDVNVFGQAMKYLCPSNKIDERIQKFLTMAFKPLIDFINDYILMEIIAIEEEDVKKVNGNTYIQNIETVNGSASQQNSGVINTNNTTNDTSSLIALIDKLCMSLSEMKGIDEETINSVNDDLEMLKEQLEKEKPKPTRIKKAVDGIKRFINEFIMKASTSYAADTITKAEWSGFLQQIEALFSQIS